MLSEMLAFFLFPHESKDQATGVGEFLSTSSSSPRFGCKESRRGGRTFLVSLDIQHGWNMPECGRWHVMSEWKRFS